MRGGEYSRTIRALGRRSSAQAVFVREHPHRLEDRLGLRPAHPPFDRVGLFLKDRLFEARDDRVEFAAAFEVSHERRAKLPPERQYPRAERRHGETGYLWTGRPNDVSRETSASWVAWVRLLPQCYPKRILE